MNNQGCGKPKTAACFLPSPWQTLFFIWWSKAFPWCKAYGLTMTKKQFKNVCSSWPFPSTISSNQGSHFTGQIIRVLKTTKKASQTSWNYPCHYDLRSLGRVNATNGKTGLYGIQWTAKYDYNFYDLSDILMPSNLFFRYRKALFLKRLLIYKNLVINTCG